ncbi:MAG TPA: PCRF domain-containing protein, partial [Thermoanaerobaculia bacterium]
MFEKLVEIERKYDDLQRRLAEPEIVGDVAKYRETMKALAEIEGVVKKTREHREASRRLAETRQMLSALDSGDAEMREMAEIEVAELEAATAALEQEIRILLQPKDPNDEKNVIVEIRAGTGGDEASLFAAEIMRMYV